jgi:hypothetical protein
MVTTRAFRDGDVSSYPAFSALFEVDHVPHLVSRLTSDAVGRHRASPLKAVRTRWRPALRVLEHAWGRPPDKIESEPVLEDGDLDVRRMSTAQLQAFVRRGRARRANVEALTQLEVASAPGSFHGRGGLRDLHRAANRLTAADPLRQSARQLATLLKEVRAGRSLAGSPAGRCADVPAEQARGTPSS